MAMSASAADGEVMVDINTTPLIDVMLVLLTLLILTLPIQTHAVKLDMPRPNQTPPTDATPTMVDLGVDFDGTITWNGDKVDRDTTGHLAAGSGARRIRRRKSSSIPNRLAKYDAVAMVLADAQHLGVTHIGFTGIDQYN